MNGPGSPARRTGIRTTLLSLATVGILAAIAVTVLVFSLKAPEQPENPEGVRTGGPGRVYGTIALAPALQGQVDGSEVLFVIARNGPGPPLAVRRIPASRFPVEYELNREDVMAAGAHFEGEVTLSARLTRSGQAGPAQPGDLEGEHAGPVQIGDRADFVLNRRR